MPAGERAGNEPAGGAGRLRAAGRRLPGWLVVGIPIVAELLVGGYRLGAASLWRDEAYTLDAAQRSFGQIFSLLLHVDAVHGPYYLGMHLVVRVLGTSAAALRLPSLLATSLAAGATAALGRRLALTSGLPAPAATGLLAGLLFVAAPQTTYYAQDARPYGLVSLFAVAATYLLVVAIADGRNRWWAAYAAAIAATGLVSLFALLLLAAHGVTLLLSRNRARLVPWLVAVAAAVAVTSPLIVLGYSQDRTLGWVTRPNAAAVTGMVVEFAGSRAVLAVAVCLTAAGLIARNLTGAGRAAVPGQEAGRQEASRQEVSVVTVALPWLVLPPVILLAVSLVKPVYVERYVVFCQPALALLAAAGVAWLAGLIAASPAGRRIPALAWAAPLVILAAVAALLIGPQRAARLTSARPDNLRGVAAVVAANERPEDAVFYVPSEARVVSMGYPGPFRKLRDVALKKSPIASDSLTGTQVSPAVLARRFAGVRRVWVVQWSASPNPGTTDGRAELALLRRMRLVRRWTVRSVVLSLYAGQP